MQVVQELPVKSHAGNGHGSSVIHLSRKEKAELRQARVDELTNEYNRLHKESKVYRVIPSTIVDRCVEIVYELKALKVFRPRRVHS